MTTPPPGLAPFWNGTVADFAAVDQPPITGGEAERHRMYSLLLMSIMTKQWNGNKFGPVGDYGSWRTAQQLGTLGPGQNVYNGGTYLGHNIAALAVDGEGHVIDYDFNHNNVFDSSVEHAESRLVRRVFALNQVYAPWSAPVPRTRRREVFATASIPPTQVSTGYSTLLDNVTIYTSLESCAQCSGIMTLASVKAIVYLQPDPGEFLIGNIMRKATQADPGGGFLAPLPIPGSQFGFEFFAALDAGNDSFSNLVKTTPFFSSSGLTSTTPSITSYLCTDDALGHYQEAAGELTSFSVKEPDFVPAGAAAGTMNNAQVHAEVADFLNYANDVNNRGTPHRV